MKADFFKRIFAYLIDYFVIMIVLMGITASVNVGSDLTKEINDVMNDYKEGNITVEEYTEKVMPLNYELTKRKLPVNVATSVVFIGYYIIFAYFTFLFSYIFFTLSIVSALPTNSSFKP